MNDILVARIIHVLAVVHWIGGVAFVTLVILPLARRQADQAFGRRLFLEAERRFSAQVRVTLPLAGAAGFWMVWRMDLWFRFADADFWWMSAMVGLWAVFMVLVFVLEPLLGGQIDRRLRDRPRQALALLERLHGLLLAAAAITILGTLAGVHG